MKVMLLVEWISHRMKRDPEAVFVFLEGEKETSEILRNETYSYYGSIFNNHSPTMVKIILFHI